MHYCTLLDSRSVCVRGDRCECVHKYTFATVSFFSVNNTECPIIDTFGQSLIVSDSHFISLQSNGGCVVHDISGMVIGTVEKEQETRSDIGVSWNAETNPHHTA